MVENAYECMLELPKRYMAKLIRDRHIILLFHLKRKSPSTAFEIIKEFVNRYLADNYEAVYSVHMMIRPHSWSHHL